MKKSLISSHSAYHRPRDKLVTYYDTSVSTALYLYIHKAKIIGINVFRTEISSPLVAYSVAFLPAYNAPPTP